MYLGYDNYESLDDAMFKINTMKVSEYAYKMIIANRKREMIDRDMHLQAWLNVRVQDNEEKGVGDNKKQVPVYKSFDEFYNPNGKQDTGPIKATKNMVNAVKRAGEMNK